MHQRANPFVWILPVLLCNFVPFGASPANAEVTPLAAHAGSKSGVIAGVSVGSRAMQAAEDRLRNGKLQSNLSTCQMGLEQYAVDHNGLYPEPGEFISALSRENYLPKNRLPPSPWSANGLSQENGIPAAALATRVREKARGGLKWTLTDLGRGHAPVSGVYDARTYGAILYDFDPKSRIYVLYGVGKDGDRAVLRARATNGRN